MAIVKESGNATNQFSFDPLLLDEFIPYVDIKNPEDIEGVDSVLTSEEHTFTLSEYIDADKRELKYKTLKTKAKTIKIVFTVSKGSSSSWDDDGYIELKLNVEEDVAKIVSPKKVYAKYDSEIEVELEITAKESKYFMLEFRANDDEDDFNSGEYENVFCGMIKVDFVGKNDWEFDEEKIDLIQKYAKANNKKYKGAGDANRYHHCTDTHKHIIYKLLGTPSDLSLGKDQNHLPSAKRMTPNDFMKAGEATTKGVRDKVIRATYGEPSKVFTVIDVEDNEILNSDGTAGNTDNVLKKFKESPIDYMESKCPSNGYYVFIGAYNDDYHSFTIIVNKEEDIFRFRFVDQIFGVLNKTGKQLESWFLLYIRGWRKNYPMNLRLYQIRNKKK